MFLQIACSLYRTQLVVLYDLLHTGFHLRTSKSQQQVGGPMYNSINQDSGTSTGRDTDTGTEREILMLMFHLGPSNSQKQVGGAL